MDIEIVCAECGTDLSLSTTPEKDGCGNIRLEIERCDTCLAADKIIGEGEPNGEKGKL